MDIELLQTITVLYVEDEAILQKEVCENLAPFLKEIILASNGEDAFEIYNQKKDIIDIIITDINMPKMNGIEFVDKLREINKEIPVIYTTAFSDNSYIFKTIEQLISGYILKPVDIEKLLDAIGKAAITIENKRLKESLEKEVALKTKELKEQYEKLHKQYYTDSLTQLPNRKALMRDLESLDQLFLALIDIDKFRSINEIYGEEVADLVLIKVGNLLKEYAKEKECFVYRINSDEFVLVKQHYDKITDCIEQTSKTRSMIQNESIYIEEFDIYVKIDVTIGMSIEVKRPLQCADIALKRAKKQRIPYLLYKEEFDTKKEYQNDIKWTQIINTALDSSQIVPFYQPIVNKNKQIMKYEALIRIVAEDEIYSPFYFLDIAKKSKLYPELEITIVSLVFQKVRQEGIDVTINISIEDITSKSFIDFIMTELQKDGIGKHITFELLESENIEDYDTVVEFINTVKSFGSKIAIDDFGSGYSNFSYLVNLQPDYIKIDGSLIKNIDKDKNAYIITSSINSIARELGIQTVAEFVHSEEVFEILQEIGIDYFQGYFFGKPTREIV